jgi:hypothetical protein
VVSNFWPDSRYYNKTAAQLSDPHIQTSFQTVHVWDVGVVPVNQVEVLSDYPCYCCCCYETFAFSNDRSEISNKIFKFMINISEEEIENFTLTDGMELSESLELKISSLDEA